MKDLFDVAAFYAALDSQRQAKNLSWKKVAQQSGVNASTLTRIAQGRRPDVDSMAALLRWSGLSADTFIKGDAIEGSPASPEALAQITAYLRADSSLTPEAATAIEAVVKATYEMFRKK